MSILEEKVLWAKLKKGGAVSKDIETDKEIYELVKYKGYEFKIYQQNDVDALYDDMITGDNVVVVNYHNDFWLTRDDVIREDEVRKLYNGTEKYWKQVEKEKGYWIFLLSCLIHSGVWLNFGGSGFVGDPGGWDTSHVGLVLVSKNYARTKKQAEKYGRRFIDEFNQVLTGDVYYMIVSKDGEELDWSRDMLGKAEIYNAIIQYCNCKAGA